ncbi:uncharacterized protein C8Q71DRAFT_765812 [Rhodofomes roseus]|uniref:RING-type domain-containing protein n=1 Tax=Rhodofomes roseus TaxID=34475 RepID=A0A4Y9XX68_9APHY|nr:uncharacterized protein C8Q71DRAFT_765812 [Rhodofomes roseus]KAH9835423.1 hypothetical protein C8Q71DRAFT_765812 [Rhodofomes roseus]TFY54278.1 hypothetical protein EVJ58_g8958 [Rhodofomes roseus]
MSAQFFMSDAELSTLYCALCDQYFIDEAACAAHVQHSSNHPLCGPCGIRFANGHWRRQHWCNSPRHHYCAACEVEFQTAAGLRVHIEYAAVHRDDSDDDDDDDDDDNDTVFADSPGWEDALGQRMFPEDVEQLADDDFDVSEPRPFTMPTPEELWAEDDELDFDEECEYLGYTSAGPPNSATTDASYPSTVLVSGTPAHECAAERAAHDAEEARRIAEGIEAEAAPAPSGVVFNCPLCLEAPEEASATRCGHVFCSPCIRSALNVKSSCPVCRTPSVPLQLRKLYLSAN